MKTGLLAPALVPYHRNEYTINRRVYERRDKSLDRADPDAPVMPPDFWQGASIGKYYRPRKTQISFRIDGEVLDGLKSKGEGHLTRINEILRRQMMTDRRKQ